MCRKAAAIAPDKPYLIGEFGAKQHHGSATLTNLYGGSGGTGGNSGGNIGNCASGGGGSGGRIAFYCSEDFGEPGEDQIETNSLDSAVILAGGRASTPHGHPGLVF